MVTDTVTFGRGGAHTVNITNQFASRDHAKIQPEQDGYVLYDLGSRNGIVVNGQRVRRHVLQLGDVIEIGDEAFRFDAVQGEQTLPHTASPTLAPQIIGLHGPRAGQRFPIVEGSCTFGRSADSTVVIASTLASRHHAEIRHEKSGYVLYDLGSRNGVVVNGERLRTRALQPGDTIGIGDELFRFLVVDSDAELTIRPLPTGTITFLFTDIEGSTQLWEHHASAMRHALARHDALIEEVVARCDGVVVRPRGEGDSRFAVFAYASDAVAAACDIQAALFAEPWPTPTPLRVRLAVHTGEADLRAGDYYGSAVNRCARLRGLAAGGQALLSLATMALTCEMLPLGVQLRDLGRHELRQLSRPEHVFQLVIPQLPNDFPPIVGEVRIAKQAASGDQLDDAVTAVQDMLRRGEVRLAGSTKPGAAKTQLILQTSGLEPLTEMPGPTQQRGGGGAI
jgi:pSer/pThr/pTyr-binding forkhead associated (FHA) protein